METMKPTSLLVLIMLTVACARGGDYYIAQAAAGSGDGSNAANAAAVTFFNTAGNWSSTPGTSGKISPGDTAHLVGTITSPLTVGQSGTSSARITVLFEANAKMSAPYWPTGSSDGQTPLTGAIYLDRKNYVTIDGGINGVIEATDNGTNLTTQHEAVGIYANQCTGLTVQNLTIQNLYVRTAHAESSPAAPGIYTYGIINTCYSGGTWANFRVTNCTIHDVSRAVFADYTSGGCSAMEVDHNTFYNVNWGAGLGNRETGGQFNTFSFHDNTAHDFSNWDDSSSNNAFHHNAVYVWAGNSVDTTTLATGIRYYNNRIGPTFGARATSAFFIQYNVTDVIEYNNLSLLGPNDAPGNGCHYVNPNKSITGTYRLFNNSIIGSTNANAFAFDLDNVGSGSGTQTMVVENNIVSTVRYAFGVFRADTISLSASHNLAFGMQSQAWSYSTTGTGSLKTLAQWQALGFDTDLITTDPRLDTDYKLTSGSPAIGAGADLSAYFTTDLAGSTRTVPWDIGAYKYDAPTNRHSGAKRAMAGANF